jgi:DNA polymerase III subunit epsilon
LAYDLTDMNTSAVDAESLATALEANPDYRVIRRLDQNHAGGPPIQGDSVRRAAIVDTETTGMDFIDDQVIEIGIVVFEYGADSGRIGPVVGRYGALEDPGRPIPPESTKIHGITDEMVRGKRFADPEIESLLQGVGIVIAHNAGFDRPFLESRLPLFAGLHWGCSIRDVHWKAHGYGSSSLEFLAFRSGFFYEAHRAETDCLALLAVLGKPLGDSGRPALHALLENARQPGFRVAALRSHIDTKNLLKARGYRWNPEDRVWVGDIGGSEREAELAWLKKAIYRGESAEVEIETLTARQRYSQRSGKKERIRL